MVPGVLDQAEVARLQAAFRAKPQDVGVGLYNVSTGEIRLGSYDTVTQGQGHQGLADALGITDMGDWRGFIITPTGQYAATSHFNLVDGHLRMKQADDAAVQQALRQAGLII